MKEEEKKFREFSYLINPKFEYRNPDLAERFLSMFKKPRDALIGIATKILEGFR